MTKRIALFNHKGGVSKTTTTFNLGWMLASKGKKVILVDTDPQCNLTGMVLGYNRNDLENFYRTEQDRNLKAALAPAFESQPRPIEPINCVPIPGQPNLFLLPGHIQLAEYEVTLGIAQELSGSIQTLQNLPGSISHLLDITAEKFRADYVLIDMSPSLSSMNQNLLMTSHYFIVPAAPDYFSVMAIESLKSIINRWYAWAERARELPILRDAIYKFPRVTPKFLGTIVQNYRPRSGAPARAFQQWVTAIHTTTVQTLKPMLEQQNMMLPNAAYIEQSMETDLTLATIADFNSLIATSQRTQTPIFALTAEQIPQAGKVLQRTLNSRDKFRTIFELLGDRVIGLTTYEERA
jgi:cellulose biosynthesis protein BcsQ